MLHRLCGDQRRRRLHGAHRGRRRPKGEPWPLELWRAQAISDVWVERMLTWRQNGRRWHGLKNAARSWGDGALIERRIYERRIPISGASNLPVTIRRCGRRHPRAHGDRRPACSDPRACTPHPGRAAQVPRRQARRSGRCLSLVGQTSRPCCRPTTGERRWARSLLRPAAPTEAAEV